MGPAGEAAVGWWDLRATGSEEQHGAGPQAGTPAALPRSEAKAIPSHEHKAHVPQLRVIPPSHPWFYSALSSTRPRGAGDRRRFTAPGPPRARPAPAKPRPANPEGTQQSRRRTGTGAKSHSYSGRRFGFSVGNQTGSTVLTGARSRCQNCRVLVPYPTAVVQTQYGAGGASPQPRGHGTAQPGRATAPSRVPTVRCRQRGVLTALRDGCRESQGESLEDFQDGARAVPRSTRLPRREEPRRVQDNNSFPK